MAKKHLFLVGALALFAVILATATSAQISPTKLSAADVTTSRGAPLAFAEWTSTATTALGTTEAFPFASDISAANRNALFVQNIRIVNRHATQYVCFFPVEYSAGCATDCPAATRTCTGASTDGDAIPPGASYTVSVTGEECPCWVGSAASTAASATRVARYAN